jgi:hypothetical protein
LGNRNDTVSFAFLGGGGPTSAQATAIACRRKQQPQQKKKERTNERSVGNLFVFLTLLGTIFYVHFFFY